MRSFIKCNTWSLRQIPMKWFKKRLFLDRGIRCNKLIETETKYTLGGLFVKFWCKLVLEEEGHLTGCGGWSGLSVGGFVKGEVRGELWKSSQSTKFIRDQECEGGSSECFVTWLCLKLDSRVVQVCLFMSEIYSTRSHAFKHSPLSPLPPPVKPSKSHLLLFPPQACYNSLYRVVTLRPREPPH
jgi:hypothetical protein